MGILRLCVAVGVGLALAAWAQSLPTPAPVDAPANQFSALRARADVAWISKAPHPITSPEHAEVRDHLLARLHELGLSTEVQHTDNVDFQYRGETKHTALDTVLARIAGTQPGLAPLLVMSHYDSVPKSPGAADDGAGVAAMLEVARIVHAQPGARDVLMAFTDGEEAGLLGAKEFFAHDAAAQPLCAVVNFDARGGDGPAYLFELGPGSEGMLRAFTSVEHDASVASFATFIYDHMPNGTDFTVSKHAGVPGLNFAFISDPGQYHTPRATVDALSMGTLQHLGNQALAAVQLLDAANLPPPSSSHLIWADLFAHGVIMYPSWVGWLLVALAALLLGLAWRSATTRAGLASATLFAVVLLVAGAVLLFPCGLLAVAPANRDRINHLCDAYRRFELALALVAAGAFLLVARWIGRRAPAADMWRGLVTIGLVIAVLLQAFAAQLSILVVWPLLPAALALFVARRPSSASIVVTTAAAAFIFGLALDWGHQFFLGLGLFAPSIMAPILLVASLGLFPLVAELSAMRHTTKVAAALVLVGYGAALSVRLF